MSKNKNARVARAMGKKYFFSKTQVFFAELSKEVSFIATVYSICLPLSSSLGWGTKSMMTFLEAV